MQGTWVQSLVQEDPTCCIATKTMHHNHRACKLQLLKPTSLEPVRVCVLSHSVLSNSLQPHGLQHARLPCPSPNSQSLHKLMSIQSVMPSNHLILYHPLLFLSSVFPSIRLFSSESVLHIKWPKYWSFSFSISPSNEYSGLISFRVDWLDLLAVQRTFKIFSNTTVQKHQPFGTQLSL